MSLEADMDPTQAKNEGNAAWSSGDFTTAVEKFTIAIEALENDRSQKELLKICYGNRSAAYLKLKRPSAALFDANKCVQLDENWAKGYSRKGDALLANGQYTEACNAYSAGLAVAPNDKVLAEKVEQSIRIRNNNSAAASGSASYPSTSSSSSSTSSSSAVSAGPLTQYQKYLKYATLGSAFAYMLPFGFLGLGIVSTVCYRVSAAFAAVNGVCALYTAYGFPKFSSEYGMKLVGDGVTMDLLRALFLLVTRPYVITLMSLCFTELVTLLPELFEYARANIGPLKESMTSNPLLARFAPQLASMPFDTMFAAHNLTPVSGFILTNAATFDLYQGVFLVFELVLPTRNPVMLYLWWQFLQMRYVLSEQTGSGHMKAACKEVDSKILTLLAYRFVPELVRQGYARLKSFLASQTKVPTAAEAEATRAGGIMGGIKAAVSKCTIC